MLALARLNFQVLIEKLLYSCPGIKRMYLLIRGSKGKSSHERLIDMVTNRPFNMRLTKDYCLSKLISVESDISLPRLGLDDTVIADLVNNVDIVFHVAASVKFDAPIEINMRHNVAATRELLELACEFKNLQSFIHVSTAYSNCQLKQIDEKVYPMTVPKDVKNFVVTQSMIDNRPNTYTYTKAVAENVASSYADRINVVIVRPSIVMSSLKEPAEGWVDTINGPIGLSVLGALGILQKIKVNSLVVFDLIPVDIVVNALITISWATTTNSYLNNNLNNNNNSISEGATVFNLTTGSENPCSFYRYFSTGREEAHRKPSVHALRPLLTIPKQKGMNSLLYWIHKVFSHLLFAYIVDMLLGVFGQKKMVIKAVNKMHQANDMFDFFCSNQWEFQTDNVKKLRELQTLEDRINFNCDIRQINWDEYARLGWIGCRRYILKESDDTIEYAKKRYWYVCLFYQTIKFSLVLLFLGFVLYIYLK